MSYGFLPSYSERSCMDSMAVIKTNSEQTKMLARLMRAEAEGEGDWRFRGAISYDGAFSLQQRQATARTERRPNTPS